MFDDGDFDEDNTFLLSDFMKHTPPEVLAKNFGVPASAFASIPDPSELYIFAAPVPGPLSTDKITGSIEVKQSFSHRMLAQTPITMKNGTARITDSKNFPVSKTIAAALVEVEPGGLRPGQLGHPAVGQRPERRCRLVRLVEHADAVAIDERRPLDLVPYGQRNMHEPSLSHLVTPSPDRACPGRAMRRHTVTTS